MSVWRVMINKKLWDVDAFRKDWKHPLTIQQSKGRAVMRVRPVRDDKVVFVCQGKIVMRGVVVSDGFVSGVGHQRDVYNRGAVREHAEPTEYADVQITWVFQGAIEEMEEVPEWKGQSTWCKIKNDRYMDWWPAPLWT